MIKRKYQLVKGKLPVLDLNDSILPIADGKPLICPFSHTGTSFITCGEQCPAFKITTGHDEFNWGKQVTKVALHCFPQPVQFEIEGDT
jgi:hypothetical protein